MRVAIIGQGYVGLTVAVGAAGAGHSVVGFDVNSSLVAVLNAGTSHIEGITDATKKFPDDFKLWELLAKSPKATKEQKNEALLQMKRLDPLNPNLK